MNDEIFLRIKKASNAFGKLNKRLWPQHGIPIETKLNIYNATVVFM